MLDSADSPVEHGRALTDLGAALRRAGGTRLARDRLRTGMDLAHASGAHAIARRARAELVATGARTRRLASRGIDALPAGERRAAERAVEGMANREIAQALFVTVRTVEGHLTNAFSKLGVASRDELRRAMSEDVESASAAR